MPQKAPHPAGGGPDRAGRIDLSLAAGSAPSLPHLTHLRQAAQERLRRQQLARRVHALGARVLFELLDELDRHHDLGSDLDRRLAAYAGLDPMVLAAAGGDRFPASPVRAIGGDR